MVVTNHLFVPVTTLWFQLHSHVQHLKQPPVCIDLKMLVSCKLQTRFIVLLPLLHVMTYSLERNMSI